MRIAFLTLLFYGLILPIFVNPFWGIVYFVAIIIFRPEQLAWGHTFGRLHLLIALATWLSWLIQPMGSGPREVRRVPMQLWLMAGVYLATILVTLTAYDPGLSAEYSSQIGKALLFGFLISRLVDRPSRVQSYIRTIALSAGLLSLWAILQYRVGNLRLEGLGAALPDSNAFAITLVMLTPMVIAAARHDSRFWKSLGFGMSGLMLVATVLSHSRTAFLALATVGVMAVIQSRRKVTTPLWLLGTTMILAIAAPATWWDRMETITVERDQMDVSAVGRLVLWEIGMKVFASHPITGVGLENFSLAKESLAGEYLWHLSPVVHRLIFGTYRVVHNTFVNALAEGGLILFLPFVAFLLSGICWRLPDRSNRSGPTAETLAIEEIARGIRLGLFGFYVGAFFLNANYIELFYWQVVLAGVVVGMVRRREESPKSQGAGVTGLEESRDRRQGVWAGPRASPDVLR